MKTFEVIYSETVVYVKRFEADSEEKAEEQAQAEIDSDEFDLKTWGLRDVFETNIDDVREVK